MPSLPPLNALRAFEAAARAGSFVQAGAELGVTSAAVSQQVRLLEDHFAKQLFVRQGNRITLTEAGRAIYPRLEQAFSDFGAMAAELREGQSRARLVISALPSLAELWLVPKLAGFSGVSGIELRVEEDPVHFARDGVDLRVTYGATLYPDHRVSLLFRDHIMPVAAASCGPLERLDDGQFIHTDWGQSYVTQPSWPAWCAAAGRPAPALTAGIKVASSQMALACSRAGMGAALVPTMLAARDVQAGAVRVLSAVHLPLPWDYVVVTPFSRQRRPALQALVAHLLLET